MGTIKGEKCLVALALCVVFIMGITDFVLPQDRNMNKAGVRKILNIAHRGARSVAPENTLVAARKAHEAGADMWEFDVQLTGDRRLVVIHDDTLLRTTDVEKVFPGRGGYRVDGFDFAEIRRLDAGSWYEDKDPFREIDKGNVTSEELKDFRGVKIPSIREALVLTKELDWRANIEIKPIEGPAILVEKLSSVVLEKIVETVNNLGLASRVVVSSFDHKLVKDLHRIDPGITGALLVEKPVSDPVGHLRFHNSSTYNVKGSALESSAGMENISEVKNAGEDFRVFVWTINEVEIMRRLVANPLIDGIITDYPGRLSRILEKEAKKPG